MEFRPITQSDLDYVRQNPFEGAIKNYPYLEAPMENCYTAVFEGAIAGVGGLRILWEGVGEVWLMLTADCKKDGLYGLVALCAIQDKMEELIRENNLWRVQATTRTDFPQAIKMMQAFGFERECLSKKYFPDKSDAFRYVRIQ